jgi:hypothetical protein
LATLPSSAIGKGWPFRKAKHGDEVRSLRAKAKPHHNHVYIHVDIASVLYHTNMSARWGDI